MYRFGINTDVPVPIGKSCDFCKETLVEGDSGISIPAFADVGSSESFYHIDCFLRTIFGSVGHQRKTCSCFGGNEEDPSGISLRHAARLAVEEWKNNERNVPECDHDAYVCQHPQYLGFFVYCADCDLVTGIQPTKEEAIKDWVSGKTHKGLEKLDRSDFSNPTSIRCE
jgi:hypothetical protein